MPVVIRAPARAELHEVAPLAAKLVRMHHAFDPDRFMLLEPLEVGYEHYLASELRNEAAVVLAAVEDGSFVGYAYGRVEPRDWNSLLDRSGAIHDLYVDERARGRGVATLLTRELIARLEAKGAPRIVLHTACKNTAAQRFFDKLGFRPTMLEMTRSGAPPRT
jgi:ribosomal protein S18 acetylase RimI-like enzyme